MQPTKEDMVENESNNLKNKLFTKIITSFVGKFLISTNFGVKSLVNILHILDRKRYRDYNELMQQHGLTDVSVSYFDHHLCHAASAYYCSGWNDSIIVTIDGSGDGYCSKVFVGNDGQLDEIKSIPMYHSPAYYYSYVTKLLGFKPMRHEGKITGLSAYGNDVDISNVLNSRISYDYKKSSFIIMDLYMNKKYSFLKNFLKKVLKKTYHLECKIIQKKLYVSILKIY